MYSVSFRYIPCTSLIAYWLASQSAWLATGLAGRLAGLAVWLTGRLALAGWLALAS